MSEVKFTKGPWTAFYKPKYDEWHVSLPMTGGGMNLALCPDGIQSENREADAHLIATAPTMFAALESAVALSDKYLNPEIGRTGECQRVYDQCVAAIARARGDQS